MDMMLSSPFAQPEGSAERKLREFGEWVIDRTEKSPRSGISFDAPHHRSLLLFLFSICTPTHISSVAMGWVL